METTNGAAAEGMSAADDQARRDAEWAARIAEADRRWATQREREAMLLPLNKAALFAALAAAGIDRVAVSFDGSGDSGQIESVDAFAGDGQALELPGDAVAFRKVAFDAAEPEVAMMPVRDVLEELAYGLLGQTHDGWENNDGAYGEFTFDVAAGSITLEYNERYIATEFHEHEF